MKQRRSTVNDPNNWPLWCVFGSGASERQIVHSYVIFITGIWLAADDKPTMVVAYFVLLLYLTSFSVFIYHLMDFLGLWFTFLTYSSCFFFCDRKIFKHIRNDVQIDDAISATRMERVWVALHIAVHIIESICHLLDFFLLNFETSTNATIHFSDLNDASEGLDIHYYLWKEHLQWRIGRR